MTDEHANPPAQDGDVTQTSHVDAPAAAPQATPAASVGGTVHNAQQGISNTMQEVEKLETSESQVGSIVNGVKGLFHL